MKKNNKKGFTIVELVIVIAVIAILAGVLIPTFTSVVKDARLSADKQTVRQLNVSLAVLGEGDDITYTMMADQLLKDGYAGDETLTPSTKGYKYYWAEAQNLIVLADAEGNIVYPEDKGLKGKNVFNSNLAVREFHASNYVVMAGTAVDVQKAVTGGNSLVIDTKFDEPITVDLTANKVLTGDITYDLGENTLVLDNSKNDERSPYFDVAAGAKLTIASGTLEARGVEVLKGGEVVVEKGATLKAVDANGGAGVWNYGTLTINGGSFVATGADYADGNGTFDKDPVALYNAGGTVVIKSGTFDASKSGSYAINCVGGTMVIGEAGAADSTVTVIAYRGCVAASSGANVTINCGTFTQLANAEGGHVFYTDEDSSITVNAGTVNNVHSLKSGNVTIADAVVVA